jgi:glycine/D-amino acid oxidase-like deaminating enzyme
VFDSTGHGRLGWTLSAVTADMVTEQVLEARTVRAAVAVPLTALGRSNAFLEGTTEIR